MNYLKVLYYYDNLNQINLSVMKSTKIIMWYTYGKTSIHGGTQYIYDVV